MKILWPGSSRPTVLIGLVAMLGSAAWYVWIHQPRPAYQPPLPAISASPRAMSAGRAPDTNFTLPTGYVVHVFADRLGLARDLVLSPGGVVLMSNPDGGTVTALPDTNHDGAADEARVVLSGARSPHGLAFYGGKLYVAEPQRVIRYHWDEAHLKATFDRELFALPANGGHTRGSLVFGADGRLFVSVGSTCNVCREADGRSATVMVTDAEGASPRVFATGLRNAAFLAANPATGEIWATENGRDNLGDAIPPDEINILRDGRNYGWPLCYGANIHDINFDRGINPCASREPAMFGIPAHSAPLGLAFVPAGPFAVGHAGDLLVAYHGSWNRTVPDGYKVVRLRVRDGAITGSEDFMSGFISGRTVAARPVDILFDKQGSLFISDDKTGTVYIIQKTP